jgi:hypothetical protein
MQRTGAEYPGDIYLFPEIVYLSQSDEPLNVAP